MYGRTRSNPKRVQNQGLRRAKNRTYSFFFVNLRVFQKNYGYGENFTFFTIGLLVSVHAISQEPNSELLRIWYLEELTVSGETFLPTAYNRYPVVEVIESVGFYEVGFADPLNIWCTSEISFSETQPETEFTIIVPAGFCFPDQTCLDYPNGPCTIIYGTHADFFYDTAETPTEYTITNNTNGTLRLTLTNSNNDVAIYNSEPVLSNQEISVISINLYPNPAGTHLFIKTEQPLNKIEIYTAGGKFLFTETNPVLPLDVSELSSGLYFMKVYQGDRVSTQKFVKR